MFKNYSVLALLISVFLLSSCGGKVTTGTTGDKFALSYKLHENPKPLETQSNSTNYESVGEYIKKNYYKDFNIAKFDIKDNRNENGTGSLFFYRIEQDVVTTYHFELAFDKNKLFSFKEVGDMVIDPTLIDNKQPDFDATTDDYIASQITEKIAAENKDKQIKIIDTKLTKRVNVPTSYFFYDADVSYTLISPNNKTEDKTTTMMIDLK